MPDWLVIATRELNERVRTRWFVIVTLLGPIAMIAVLVVPVYLAATGAEKRVTIDVVDQSGHDLLPAVASAASQLDLRLDLRAVAPDVSPAELQRRIRDQERSGFLTLPPDVLSGGAAVYRGDNVTNFKLRATLSQVLNAAAVTARARAAGVEQPVIASLLTPHVRLAAVRDNGTGQSTSADATFIIGYVVMFVLYLAILLYAVNVMRSVVLEKSSRVVEILVSAVKPRALMLGKVLGVGGAGLLQLGIWALVGLVLVHFRGAILGAFGVPGADALALPPLGVGDALVVLAYFALGYFFYAALYAAIGAMVNSDQEAQQAQTPVVLLLIVPVACVQLVANDPRGGVAEALTMIPFFSPILMPMRWLLGGATGVDLALSLGILAVSLLGAVALAGRIFRVGILMYGKRPSLRELARWIRHS